MREISGFETLKVFKHGYLWYIVDCTPGHGDPFRHSIGGHFKTYKGACTFAQMNYVGIYQ